MSLAPDHNALSKPEALLRIPVGFASPLWGVFTGAAMTGAAWWWMTRWAQPDNVEAMFGAMAKAALPATPVEAAAVMASEIAAEVEAATHTVVEAVEPAAEVSSELSAEVLTPALEVLPEPVELVGGEAAPISPILQALPLEAAETAADAEDETVEALKPRRRSSTPKVD